MTLTQIIDLINSVVPTTYRAWPEGEAPPLPFACVLCTNTTPLPADSGVYYTYSDVAIELYCAVKDPALEARLEAALAGIVWHKSEEYIKSENCYKIVYEIEV